MMKQDFLVIEISHICPTRPELNDRSSQKQHALKGQKLLAQGNALGIKAFSKAPCKGKSFKTSGNNKASALSGRAASVSFCPLPLLYPSVIDFQFSSASDRWLRACGVYLRKLNI